MKCFELFSGKSLNMEELVSVKIKGFLLQVWKMAHGRNIWDCFLCKCDPRHGHSHHVITETSKIKIKLKQGNQAANKKLKATKDNR